MCCISIAKSYYQTPKSQNFPACGGPAYENTIGRLLINPPLLAQIPANKGGFINKQLIVKSPNMRNMIVWEAIAV